MKNFWTKTFRRLAAGAIVAGATAYSSAMCYAALAFDSAADPVYADGWQAGDNGGFGFTPWNFDARFGAGVQYTQAGFKNIDDGLQLGTHYSNPNNSIGRSWVTGALPGDTGAPHIGRGFSLAVGETLNVVIDNPTQRAFFKGYTVKLNGGTGGVNGNLCPPGGNTCTAGATVVEKMAFGRFEYFNNGQWFIYDAGTNGTGVFDTDTSAAGARISVKRTGTETYDVTLDSLGGAQDYSASRTFNNAGPNVDWIEFVFFNTVTDTTPTVGEGQTDFYISSMSIVPEPATGALLVMGGGTLLALGTARRRRLE